MKDFLLQNKVSNTSPELYDHQYFYINKSKGHIVCGLVRDTVSSVLRNLGRDIFLGNEWLMNFHNFKNNPIVLGFIIEQLCITRISREGLYVDGEHYLSSSTYVCKGQVPIFDTNNTYTLYVPFAYNFKAIDALLLKVNSGNAHLVPIQITIAGKHKDSVSDFSEIGQNGLVTLANQVFKLI
jgi:hypothetical protein